jgi:hypothetical protein
MATVAGTLTGTSNTSGVQELNGPLTLKDLRTLIAKPIDLASAASVAVPATGVVFNLTGTTEVTALTGHSAGRIIILINASTAKISAETTHKLAGAADGPVTAFDVLGLISDGTNWIELFRSVNA